METPSLFWLLVLAMVALWFIQKVNDYRSLSRRATRESCRNVPRLDGHEPE